MISDLPNIDPAHLQPIDTALYAAADDTGHPPRILILHGSVRKRSYSRGVADEAERLLTWFGAEVRRFDPSGLPLPDDAEDTHPKVQELRNLAIWSEGMLWSSPERHGTMSAIMKAQIDWIPLTTGGVRPTQGKTLALYSGQRRLPEFQCRQSDAHPWTLDAYGNNPKPILSTESLG